MDVIQPHEIFEMLKIKNKDEAEKIVSTVMNLLIYLKIGDEIITSTSSFKKISPDLIYINSDVKMDQVVDSLERKKIISFPV